MSGTSTSSEPRPGAPARRHGGVSAIFVNFNSWGVCADAVASLVEHRPRAADGSPLPLEIVVVDNASPHRDPFHEARLREALAAVDGELILHDENGGYSKGMNLGLRRCSGEFVLVCNPDVVFLPGCVDGLIRGLEADPAVGATIPSGYWDAGLEGNLPAYMMPGLHELLVTTMSMLFPMWGRFWSRRHLPNSLALWEAQEAQRDIDIDMFAGCLFLMRRSLIDAIGFFDERYPLYFEDADLARRLLRAGKKARQVGKARFVHLFNRSGQTAHGLAMERHWIGKVRYFEKYYGRLGRMLVRGTQWLQTTAWAQKRIWGRHHRLVHPVEVVDGVPVVRLPRASERFVVEHCMDPFFLLTAGAFGSGDRWSPGPALFENWPAGLWLRVVDLAGDRPEIVGVWRWERPAEATP